MITNTNNIYEFILHLNDRKEFIDSYEEDLDNDEYYAFKNDYDTFYNKYINLIDDCCNNLHSDNIKLLTNYESTDIDGLDVYYIQVKFLKELEFLTEKELLTYLLNNIFESLLSKHDVVWISKFEFTFYFYKKDNMSFIEYTTIKELK